MQSKKSSLIESIVNTFVGLVVNITVSPVVYWITGVTMNVYQLSGTAVLFTIVSIIRNYIIRRFFNKTKV